MSKKTLKKNFFKFILSLLIFSAILIPFKSTLAAGLIPCGFSDNDPCTLCHFLVGFKGILDWGMKILITLSITAISIAGVMYVISSGSPEISKQAKSFVTSVLIGFALMLGAWLIVNTTFWIFSAKKEGAEGAFGLEGKSWNSFTCSTVSSSTGATTTGQGGVAAEPIATSFDCNNFTFQANIKNQCTGGDASEELKTLMICLKSKFGAKMTVNSISDSKGLQNCISNYEASGCAHAKSSCHYGGVTGGKSQAVDISSRTGLNIGAVTTAVKECGLDPAKSIKDESSSANHFHISTSSCQRAY
jgi:hypothetical protein